MEEKEENLYMIKNLRQLVEPHIGCERSRILSANYSRLKKPGDDNGLTWLKIDVNLLNTTTGEEWRILLVAKSLPKNMDSKYFLRIQKAFKKEVGIYMSAKPALDLFLREKGIKNGADFFATPFGGRLNLDGGDIVDQHSVLILQDYNSLGFTIVPRRIGFDLESSKLFLKALAKFHGTFLGLKHHNLTQFNEKVKPYLSNSYGIEEIERIARAQMIQVLQEKEFSPDVIGRAVATFDRKSVKQANEPWATFIHNNAWVNNILIRFEKHGESKYVKLVDFSDCGYNSPLRDLLFFLFSSVELGILKTHLEDLLDHYYYSFINILKRVDVTDKELFCRMSFNKELKFVASNNEFYKILCRLYPTLATKPFDISCDNIGEDIPELKDALHKKRLCYIVTEFENKGWLCA